MILIVWLVTLPAKPLTATAAFFEALASGPALEAAPTAAAPAAAAGPEPSEPNASANSERDSPRIGCSGGFIAPRSTGSHCGGHATGCSTSASLLATLSLVMCGMKAVKKAAATPMKKSVWKREAFAYMRLRRQAVQVTVQNIGSAPMAYPYSGGIAEWAGTVQDRLSWRDGEDGGAPAARYCCGCLQIPQPAS